MAIHARTSLIILFGLQQSSAIEYNCGSFLLCNLYQLKSLETTLAGALRREQMADGAVKQLEAEIEQLNRLVTFIS